MPYEWICESCGLRLYSASAETDTDRCPRCGAPLPEATDAAPLPPPDEEGAGE
jgi:tRNA(Ile2) C34 agmatinyltransferase TiaS